MALSGIEIFKLLPKTNCGDCGVPTCLAFAMSLAAGKSELAKCPHVSEEARSKLEEAAAPPIRLVSIGKGEKARHLRRRLSANETHVIQPPCRCLLLERGPVDSVSD